MSHLTFREETPKPKTRVFTVISNHDGSDLGVIQWHSGWRQYVLSTPNASCIWSWDCLKEVSEFIKKLMDGRK